MSVLKSFKDLFRNGKEVVDATPVEVPLRFRNIPHTDRIRELVRQELSAAAASYGMETLDESCDFGEDDGDPEEHLTKYELTTMKMDGPYEDADDDTRRARMLKEQIGRRTSRRVEVDDREVERGGSRVEDRGRLDERRRQSAPRDRIDSSEPSERSARNQRVHGERREAGGSGDSDS